jgi:hypothetical protein
MMINPTKKGVQKNVVHGLLQRVVEKCFLLLEVGSWWPGRMRSAININDDTLSALLLLLFKIFYTIKIIFFKFIFYLK